jgi:hypothetical protein
MADLKISQLTGATTPLAGTEVLPIVQSNDTKQVSIANLTAGRTQTSNGIVQGTAGTGYNFTANTPNAGVTSQLLNWYEEGTYTPVQNGLVVVGAATLTGTYTRIGRQVFYSIKIASTGTTASTAGAVTITLPFTKISTSLEFGMVVIAGVTQGPIEADPGLYFYPCSWAASANVYASGSYTI